MHEWEEFYALFLLWLALVALVGFYVVRIGLLLREQWLTERAYRTHLAVKRGRALREGSSGAEGQG